MEQLRNVKRVFLGLAFLSCVSGCQYGYTFEFSGTVRTSNGAPLPGVSITINATDIRDSSFPVVTLGDGTYKATVRIMDIAFMRGKLPTWSLELKKDGYETATVDVSPKQEPKSAGKTTFVTADGILKPR
jgi:hypothetical protein